MLKYIYESLFNSVLKPLVSKFQDIIKLIHEFDLSIFQQSCQTVGVYFFGQGWYLCWMELPPIRLSACDWAPENLNLFNKS